MVKRVRIDPAALAEAARPSEPTTCRTCKHVYWHPCHGENPKCMNIEFMQRMKKGGKTPK